MLNEQFYEQISLSGYYADIEDFSLCIALTFNQGELNIIKKYVFMSSKHAMAMIMKKTAYNTGWVIGYDPNVTFQCMIFHIKPINDRSQIQGSIDNPWAKIKQFMHSREKNTFYTIKQWLS
ncbi:MAG: hypothetical protein HAW62_04270 [Endozoicomonadaceae bacterium]|nr:hypothetical protein [Endozoicomonadaceae bacterium]